MKRNSTGKENSVLESLYESGYFKSGRRGRKISINESQLIQIVKNSVRMILEEDSEGFREMKRFWDDTSYTSISEQLADEILKLVTSGKKRLKVKYRIGPDEFDEFTISDVTIEQPYEDEIFHFLVDGDYVFTIENIGPIGSSTLDKLLAGETVYAKDGYNGTLFRVTLV